MLALDSNEKQKFKKITWFVESKDKLSARCTFVELNLLCGSCGWGCCKLCKENLGACIVGVLRCDESRWTMWSTHSGATLDNIAAGKVVSFSASDDTVDEATVVVAERFRVFELMAFV